MSVPYEHRGNRINQLLWLCVQQAFIKHGAKLGLGWIDTRHNWKGSSSSIYTKKSNRVEYSADITCYVKALDEAVSKELGKLNFLETGIIKAVNKVFKNEEKQKAPIKVQLFDKSMGSEVSRFILECGEKSFYPLFMAPEKLAYRYTFEKPGIAPIMLVYQESGTIKGIFSGIAIPIKGKHCYFQTDILQLAEDVGYARKNEFIRSSHAMLNKAYNCFAVITPGNISTDNLMKFGYIPLGSQALIGNTYDTGIEYDDEIHRHLNVDLV